MSEHQAFDFGMALDGEHIEVLRCRACHTAWPCLPVQLAASESARAALVELVAEALPLMESEWIGLDGPIGEGGDWIVKARALLATEAPAAAAPQLGGALPFRCDYGCSDWMSCPHCHCRVCRETRLRKAVGRGEV